MTKVKKSHDEYGDRLAILADKGFNIQDLLLQYNVELVIPPFLRGKSQFSEVENCKTKSVANARIHIERVIQRLKIFRILQGVVASEFYDLLDSIVIVCAAFTNISQPIVPMK